MLPYTPLLAVDFGNGGPDLLNDVANRYINAVNAGFPLIRGDVTFVLNVLIVVSVAWSAALWALSEEQVVAQLARKIVYVGLFAWLVQNWQSLTDKLARSFMDLGLKAGGFDNSNYYTQQPGDVAYLGYTTVQPLIDQIARLSGPVAFFKNIAEIAFLFVAVVAIITAFCVIAVQVVVALLTFKFGSLAAFVLVPFGVLAKTSFIAERPLGWVVASGVRLMVLTLVLGVGNGLFQQLKLPPGSTVTTYEAFCVALAAVLLAVLSLTASRLATDLVSGGPSLGVGSAAATVANAYRATAGSLAARPAVMAVKAAAAVGTGGVAVGATAARAAARGVGSVAKRAAATATRSGAGSPGGVGSSLAKAAPIPVVARRRMPSAGGGASRNGGSNA